MDQPSTNSPKRRVVVVEDEMDVGSLLEFALAKEGFRVGLARSGQEALEEIRRDRTDVIVLDLMLPDMSGLDVLREVRRNHTAGDAPRVIILSALASEEDRLRGFELGATDYMVKPFSPRELIYRIGRLLQQEQSTEGDSSRIVTVGPIRIDLEQHEVRVSGKTVHLTLTEFRLLADMARNKGRVRTRDALMSEVWAYDTSAMSRTIDTHVRRLRQKLGDAASWLRTVRGVGYRIQDPEQA